jgi:WD40 repeat protein
MMRGHKGWIRGLIVTADGKYFVSGSDDKMIKFWSSATGQEMYTLGGHRGAVSCVATSR